MSDDLVVHLKAEGGLPLTFVAWFGIALGDVSPEARFAHSDDANVAVVIPRDSLSGMSDWIQQLQEAQQGHQSSGAQDASGMDSEGSGGTRPEWRPGSG